jgi:hypothetical protein
MLGCCKLLDRQRIAESGRRHGAVGPKARRREWPKPVFREEGHRCGGAQPKWLFVALCSITLHTEVGRADAVNIMRGISPTALISELGSLAKFHLYYRASLSQYVEKRFGFQDLLRKIETRRECRAFCQSENR